MTSCKAVILIHVTEMFHILQAVNTDMLRKQMLAPD